MMEIPISEFRTHCSKLIERARRTHKPIRITSFGKPVAVVVPCAADVVDRASMFGSMEGSMKFLGEIVSPANDEEDWECLSD